MLIAPYGSSAAGAVARHRPSLLATMLGARWALGTATSLLTSYNPAMPVQPALLSRYGRMLTDILGERTVTPCSFQLSSCRRISKRQPQVFLLETH